MKQYIIESIKIVRSNLMFILILAFTGTLILSNSGIMQLATAVRFMLWLILMPAIYGRFAEIIKGEQHGSCLDVFTRHWLDFYAVRILLGIPSFIFSFFFKSMLTWKTVTVGKATIAAVVGVLTLYVLPLVFIKRQRLVAIRSGITYQLENGRYNMPLVALVVASALIQPLVLIAGRLLSLPSTPLVFNVLGFVSNSLSLFIEFTVFVAASMVLMNESASGRSCGEPINVQNIS